MGLVLVVAARLGKVYKMQRAPAAIDIGKCFWGTRVHTILCRCADGRQVHIGSPVQLKWLGVWYEGFVVEIGPKRNLCKVNEH